jgi:hypothetical protein
MALEPAKVHRPVEVACLRYVRSREGAVALTEHPVAHFVDREIVLGKRELDGVAHGVRD